MPRRSQEDRSRATRAALEQAGRRLFAEHGYARVSAAQIVAAAGVTRGALQHHYGDKRGLFLAVLEQLESDNAAEITRAIAELPDPADLPAAMAVGLRTFLEQCRRTETVRIAMSDALTVLGWEGWRELERRYGLGLITDMLDRATRAGVVTPAPVHVLAQLILSAVTEAGMIIAHAEDPDTARLEAEQSMLLLLGGILRTP
ncbi:TetR/AcrR family transcriptional regulator [Nocardia sp. CDC159]|uniref:TetR/AcrR family transcriptional regulator n=1 Tax=Nocardia pulmonis TaxID=2951408 RepID=A0A9X2E500_9NOCA|nr:MULTISPECIES: TetR/AcrR family transcriptional regulator [Nocardia]MCM6772965.1 TetR/AcrR family transcriptional regulator [Nocardia pulmonis]MCM6785732.1 TetR/AcrR family transcriptional regulator [Nocardia sp. CDC159]